MNGLKENECPDLLTLAKARGSVIVSCRFLGGTYFSKFE